MRGQEIGTWRRYFIVDVIACRASDKTEFWRQDDVTFVVGEATEAKLPCGIDKAVRVVTCLMLEEFLPVADHQDEQRREVTSRAESAACLHAGSMPV